jgi:purine nucleosidase
LPVDGRHLHGIDGLGGVQFQVAELHHQHPSEKVIGDQVRDAPEASVTLVALGPLTNVARVFVRDPQLAGTLGHIVMMGGTIAGPGNITPAAEFNVYCDPRAAQTVLRSRATKTLIPLDVTNQIVLGYNLFDQLPDDSTKVGRFLRKLLPPAFRNYRQQFGLEGIHVHDTVALMSVIHPELFTTVEMAGDVETAGELTTGMTVFDRRRVPAWRHNLAVATEMHAEAVIDAIIRGLQTAAQLSK